MAHPLQSGNVVVITGGASGIGFCCARLCGDQFGMRVVILDSDQTALDAASDALRSQNVDVLALCADVTSAEAMAAAQRQVWTEFGACHVLFLNAGIGGGGSPLQHPERWRQVFEVNLLGVLNGVQAFVPAMMRQAARGVVAITSSRAGITTPPFDAAYTSSKAAVRVLAESLEHQLRNTKDCLVSARLLLPGTTNTQIGFNTVRRIKGEEAARRSKSTAMGPAAVDPEQVVTPLLRSIKDGGPFYVVCEDGEMTVAQFDTAVRWSAEDVAMRRPPLSRWLEPFRSEYLSKL